MTSFAVQRAVREWESEVAAEMVRLIESGVPPFDATGQAREIVSRRRAAKAAEQQGAQGLQALVAGLKRVA